MNDAIMYAVATVTVAVLAWDVFRRWVNVRVNAASEDMLTALEVHGGLLDGLRADLGGLREDLAAGVNGIRADLGAHGRAADKRFALQAEIQALSDKLGVVESRAYPRADAFTMTEDIARQINEGADKVTELSAKLDAMLNAAEAQAATTQKLQTDVGAMTITRATAPRGPTGLTLGQQRPAREPSTR